jgi:hypothetical protein
MKEYQFCLQINTLERERESYTGFERGAKRFFILLLIKKARAKRQDLYMRICAMKD